MRYARTAAFKTGLAAFLASALAGQAPAAADTVEITAAKDNTLFEESAANSNGGGDFLFAGLTNRGDRRRALLSFDIAASVPAGATVTAVTLTLRQSRTISGSHTVSLHRMQAGWGEAGSNAGGQEGGGAGAQNGDATWSHAVFAATPWAAPGGDFAAGESASAAVGGSGQDYGWSGAGLVSDVQAWLDDPAQNFGWALLGDEGANASAKRFNSRENSDTPPTLTVEFDPPPANTPPQVSVPVVDQELRLGGLPLDLDLDVVFSDDDGDSLVYGGGTSNSSILDVALDGDRLSVNALGAGSATVSLSATDPSGARATDIFTVVVSANTPPVAGPIVGTFGLEVGQPPLALDLNEIFSDDDGDALTFTALSSEPAVAAAAVDGAQLSLTPLAAGDAQITLSADDGFGGSASIGLVASVNEPPPPPSANDGFGVSVSPANAALQVGDALEIALSASGAVEAKSTLVTAVYDGSLLNFVEFVPGGLIPGLITLPGTPEVGEDGLSTVQGGGTQLVGTPGAGEGVLGTLRFETVGEIPADGAFVSIVEVQLNASAADRSILTFARGALGAALGAGGKTGDFSGDDRVDFDDFFLFADQFGSSSDGEDWDPAFDLVPNGTVDFDDFFAFADVFGQ